MLRWFHAVFVALLGFSWFVSASAEGLLTITNSPADPYREAMQALSEGRIDDARGALAILVANEPESPGAWLDLATLRCSLGDAVEAERLFKEIESRFSPPSGIVEIIDKQRATRCRGRQRQTQALVRLGRGFDSNANQGTSNPFFSIGSGSNKVDLVVLPTYRPLSDQYSALSADYISDLALLDNSSGFVQFRARRYDRLSNVDTISALAGIERAWHIGDWLLRGTVSGGVTTLGGKPYLNQGQLLMQLQPPVSLPTGWQFVLTGGWSHLSYPSYQMYNSNIYEARSSLRFQREQSTWQASAGALFDQQANQRPGGDRRGYFASLEGRFRITQGVFGEVGWQSQQWQAQEAYSPDLINIRRRQNTRLLRAGISIPIAANQSILIGYQYTDNLDNISLFQYKEQLIQANWQYLL